MSTEASTPAAVETPAPAAPAKPVTPAIPAAQAASAPVLKTEVPTKQEKPKNASEASFQANLRKISQELEAKQEAEKTGKPVEPAAKETPAPAETKPEEKPVEPVAATAKDRFGDIAPPDGATEVTKKGWNALKTKANAEIEAAEKKLADAQSQIETFRKATPAEAADVAKLQADLKAAHDRLAVLDYSAHPEFAQKFLEPKKKALGEAKLLLTDNAIENAPDMASLLSLPRAEFSKKVSELAATMPAFDQGSFVTAMREAHRLQGEEKVALEKSRDVVQALEAKTAQQQKQAFEETFTDFGNKMKPLEIPTDATEEMRSDIEDYNKALAAIRPSAETYAFGRIDDKGVGALAAKAASLDFLTQKAIPRLQRDFDRRMTAADSLIKELTTKLEGVRAAKNPGQFAGAQEAAARPASSFADVARQVGMKNP